MAIRLPKIEMQLMSLFFSQRGEDDALMAGIYISSSVFMLGYPEAAAAGGKKTKLCTCSHGSQCTNTARHLWG